MSITTTHRFARLIALPVVSLGIIGGAALGLSGTANAAEVAPALPQTTAEPATNASPGNWWHRHHPSLLEPITAANFMPPGA